MLRRNQQSQFSAMNKRKIASESIAEAAFPSGISFPL